VGSAIAAAFVAAVIAATPASANCGNDKPVGRPADECPGQTSPNLSATPELDSLVLFGSGAVGLVGYGLTRLRAGRRQAASPADER
jgi:hypothetical protein